MLNLCYHPWTELLITHALSPSLSLVFCDANKDGGTIIPSFFPELETLAHRRHHREHTRLHLGSHNVPYNGQKLVESLSSLTNMSTPMWIGSFLTTLFRELQSKNSEFQLQG